MVEMVDDYPKWNDLISQFQTDLNLHILKREIEINWPTILALKIGWFHYQINLDRV